MSKGQHETQGVYRIRIDGSWLRGSKIYACAVQTPDPGLEVMLDDASRPEALKLAEALFVSPSSERLPLVGVWSLGDPSIVVFPELAFGTDDFDALDDWINELSSPVIVIAGFGFCSGERLEKLLVDHPELEHAWPSSYPIDHGGSYNGGWCWIRRPRGKTRRIVFLKNFAEQKVETVEVPNWTKGKDILRLDSEDLTVFPLICADLIQDPLDEESPRARLRESLAEQDPASRILIVGLLHSGKTWSDFWSQALIDFTSQVSPDHLAVFLVNQARPKPFEKEDQDKWRSLTGVFRASDVSNRPPISSLDHVRYVETVNARGLLLRLTERPGVAAGELHWELGPNRSLYVWDVKRRFSWSASSLVEEKMEAQAQELSRFIDRHRTRWMDDRKLNTRLYKVFEKRLERARRWIEDQESRWIDNLWPQLLEGPVSAKDVKSTPDQLHKFSAPLSRALRILAAFCHEDLAERVIDPKVKDLEESKPKLKAHLCLLDSKSHIAIWSDPKLDPDDQIRKLEKYVSNPGRTLFVLGAGAGGVNPERQEIGSEQKDVDSKRQKVVQGPRSNIGRASRLGPSRDESPIDKPRKSARNIWWINLGFFEVILKDASWIEIPAAQASSELNERLRKKIL